MPEENFTEDGKKQEEPEEHPSGKGEASEEGVDAVAILSYLGILCLVPLLAKQDDEFAQFHAKQGLVLFIAEVITMFVVAIPIIGWIIGPIAWIVWVVLSIIGIVHVIQNKRKQVPLVGGFASQLKM